jgi:hypothetical protein
VDNLLILSVIGRDISGNMSWSFTLRRDKTKLGSNKMYFVWHKFKNKFSDYLNGYLMILF